MRFRSLVVAVSLFLAVGSYAQEPKAYLSGKLQQINLVQCGLSSNEVAADEPQAGSNSAPAKARPTICPEYVLETEEVIYRIRPKNAQPGVLLPVGEPAQFRVQNDELLLVVQALDSREREYSVVSIAPRADNSADSYRLRLNHLQ